VSVRQSVPEKRRRVHPKWLFVLGVILMLGVVLVFILL